MNVQALEETRHDILMNPLAVDIGAWGHEDKSAPCGYVGCIAGHGAVRYLTQVFPGTCVHIEASGLYTNGVWRGSSYSVGMQAFGLTDEQADRLFMVSNWPTEFRKKILLTVAETPEHARIVAARIDHFLATEGKE
jgi:hypothetical protein